MTIQLQKNNYGSADIPDSFSDYYMEDNVDELCSRSVSNNNTKSKSPSVLAINCRNLKKTSIIFLFI